MNYFLQLLLVRSYPSFARRNFPLWLVNPFFLYTRFYVSFKLLLSTCQRLSGHWRTDYNWSEIGPRRDRRSPTARQYGDSCLYCYADQGQLISRVLPSTSIIFLQQTFDGQCLFVDPTSGDFRENLTPIQTKPCDASAGQKWDIITAGKHNDKSGFALIVSSQVLSTTKLLPIDLVLKRDHRPMLASILIPDGAWATKCFSSLVEAVQMAQEQLRTRNYFLSTTAKLLFLSDQRTVTT